MTVLVPVSQRARVSYLALYSIVRRNFSCCSRTLSRRSDLSGHGYTGMYEPGKPVQGPIADASPLGAPKFTPKMLKANLDEYVVGQEKVKKQLSVAVYNHMLRVQELERREREDRDLEARRYRAFARTHYGDEDAVHSHEFKESDLTSHAGSMDRPLISKSNVLMLGPSGVGKTLMARTLASFVQVPFSISDCTPFTQAGYVGEDAETCIHRLVASSGYNIPLAEHGIVFLDEIDKTATAKVRQGRDVSGEGVQQSLLKIVEGTTLQVPIKQDRSARPINMGQAYKPPTENPFSDAGAPSSIPAQGKGDSYTVRTDNILFICAGAFIGLDKIIQSRVAKGSMGFENPLPSSETNGFPPFFFPSRTALANQKREEQENNPLALVEPEDLRNYGMIPELVGRLPVIATLAPLSLPLLFRILVEPKDSLLSQFVHMFSLFNVELRFTTAALHAIAENAQNKGTGARGLRAEMERVLAPANYEAPGSSIRYIGVTEAAVRGTEELGYFSRGGGSMAFRHAMDREDAEWKESNDKLNKSFEEYRAKAAGTA